MTEWPAAVERSANQHHAPLKQGPDNLREKLIKKLSSTLLKPLGLSFALIVTFAATQGTARADPLAIGQSISGPSNATFFGGRLLVFGGLASPVNAATFTGTARTAVFFTPGRTLDFYYQFTNDGPDDIERLSFFNFHGISTEVFTITNGSALGVGFVDGSVSSVAADRGPNAAFDSVGFSYAPGTIVPGTTSMVIVIRTNASNFVDGIFTVTGSSEGSARSYAPAAPVPEPATMLLLGTGLAGVAARVRRRREARR